MAIVVNKANLKRLLHIITYRCNLRCTHCFYWGPDIADDTARNNRGEELSTSEIIELVLYPLQQLGGTGLTITGGEPLIRKDIFDILLVAEQLNLETQLQTNLTIRVKELLSILHKLNNLSVQISIDGPPNCHDTIRGAGNFEVTLKAIKEIITLRNSVGFADPKIHINCVLIKQNLGNFDDLVPILAQAGVKSVSFQLLSWDPPTVTDEITSSFKVEKQYQLDPDYQFAHYLRRSIISSQEVSLARDAAQRAITLAQNLGLQIAFFPVGPTHWEKHLESWFNTHDLTHWKGCSYIYGRTRVDPFGNVFPCMEIPMGNVRDEPLDKIWLNKKYGKFRYCISEQGSMGMCRRCCNLEGLTQSYTFSELAK